MSLKSMEKENEPPEFTLPFILRIAFEYDPATLANANNKIKCKGCEKQLLFCQGNRTSNLISHLRDTNKIKHKVFYDAYLQGD